MTELEALEAALRARFDPDALAVYADYLQSTGDVRGELIALELAITRTGRTLAREIRRDELLHAWLGTPRVGTPRFGFLELDLTADLSPSSILDAAFDGPGGPFAQSITIDGPPQEVARAITSIARAPRAWLTKLAVHQTNARLPSISNELWSDLVAATPHLDSLELSGSGIVEELHHPSVRRLRLTGLDGFDVIELPAVTDLDLAFCSAYMAVAAEEHAEVAVSIIDNLPALERLDLSRCGPGQVAPFNLGGSIPVFALLSTLEARRQLVELRLPPLVSVFDASDVAAAIARMPALTKLVLFQTTNAIAELLRHPRIAVELA